MSIPKSFIAQLPKIRHLVRYYEVHKEAGPIDIDKLITQQLKIKLRYSDFHDDQWIQGFSHIAQNNPKKKYIVINNSKSFLTQRFVKAHELGHVYLHKPTEPLLCNPLCEDKIMEREANYFAAFIMVHPGAIDLIRKHGVGFDDIAQGLYIPRDLVQKRYELYLQLNRTRSPNPEIFNGLDVF